MQVRSQCRYNLLHKLLLLLFGWHREYLLEVTGLEAVDPMATVKECVQSIVRDAQTLYERLKDGSNQSANAGDMEKTEQILEQWRGYAAAHDNLVFAKRLAWDGISEDMVLPLLNNRLDWEQMSSEWMILLEEVLQQIGSVNAGELRQSTYISKDDQQPFEEIHMLFVNTGIKRIYDRRIEIDSLITREALTNLVGFLLRRLSGVSNNVLFKELEMKFSQSGKAGVENEGFWLPPISSFRIWSDSSTIWGKRYSSFIDRLLAGEILAVLEKYPVMARLMAEMTLFWVNNAIELFNSLTADMDQISRIFSDDRHPGRVITIQCGLSDPHNRGQSVAKLDFEKGLKLIYKPRDLGIEESYFSFAAQINALGGEDMFGLLKILNKGSHGWVEYCGQIPCSTEQEVVGFYRHSGMLAGMLYILAGYDFHNENVIAHGEYPVAVDLEVLLQPQPEHDKSINLSENSVLDTSLLPAQFFKGKNGYFSLDGLGGGHAEEKPAESHQNEDFISICPGGGWTEKAASQGCVYLGDRLARPDEYLDEIEEGFKKAYRIFLKHRERLLSEESPLRLFENKKIRYVVRKTDLYSVVLYNSVRPQYLKNGLVRSIRLDKISRTLLTTDKKPHHWPLIRQEHKALDRGDIPIFYADTCKRHLENESGQAIEGFFTMTPMEVVKKRISDLSEENMTRQCALIRESYRLRTAVMEGSRQAKDYTGVREQNSAVDRDLLLNTAGAIADYIYDSAIIANENFTWLNAVAEVDSSVALKLMRDDLYNGRMGIFMFLAASRKVLGENEDREYLWKLQKNAIRQTVSRIEAGALRNGHIGAGKGIGGIIYSLVKMAEFSGDEFFLNQAVQLSEVLSEQMIADDAEYDVLLGSAGAILGLLALYGTCPLDRVLDCAVKSADHLLECRVEAINGLRAWKPTGVFTFNNQPAPGFFRGITGITTALQRLYNLIKEEKYKEASREAIIYENGLVFDKNGGWSGLKGRSAESSLSWCDGAAGICLNRMEAGNMIGISDSQFKTVLDLIKAKKDLGRDDLCWGNFGLIDVLISTSYKLADAELYDEALKRAKRYIDAVNGSGGISAFSNLGFHDLSFFQGISGIGYVLLRLVDKQLPSILAFK